MGSSERKKWCQKNSWVRDRTRTLSLSLPLNVTTAFVADLGSGEEVSAVSRINVDWKIKAKLK